LTLAKVQDDGTSAISEPYGLDVKWDFEAFKAPKSAAGGSW